MPYFIAIIVTGIINFFATLLKKLTINTLTFMAFLAFWLGVYLFLLSQLIKFISSLITERDFFAAEFWKAGVSLLPEKSPTYMTIIVTVYGIYWAAILKDRMSNRLAKMLKQ